MQERKETLINEILEIMKTNLSLLPVPALFIFKRDIQKKINKVYQDAKKKGKNKNNE